MRWHDASSLEIEGRGWADTAGPFERLPDSAKSKATPAVWGLSKDSAGLCIRFLTDSATVHARWSLTSGSLSMPHMPATGVSGLDLYARSADGSWRFVGNAPPAKQDDNTHTFTFPDGGRPDRECLLYLPLYNGTKSLALGVPAGRTLRKPDPRPESLRRPVVVYGTSIVQGGCASRPGMAWPAILGRLLERPVINLGFSGSALMEPPLAEVLAELDPALFVVDCIWNMGDAPDLYQTRVPTLVRTLRAAHPQTPILFVGQSLIRPGDHPTKPTRDQEAAVQALQAEGVPGLFTAPGTDLVGDDGEATVDGVHMTDLGMHRQAHALLPAVQKILAAQPEP
jgi:hypothetical protein